MTQPRPNFRIVRKQDSRDPWEIRMADFPDPPPKPLDEPIRINVFQAIILLVLFELVIVYLIWRML